MNLWCGKFIYTVLSLASGHLSHAFGIPWLCFFAWLAEYWAKQKMQLPISAIHQQKSTAKVCQMRETGGQKACDSTVRNIIIGNCLHFSHCWISKKLFAHLQLGRPIEDPHFKMQLIIGKASHMEIRHTDEVSKLEEIYDGTFFGFWTKDCQFSRLAVINYE